MTSSASLVSYNSSIGSDINITGTLFLPENFNSDKKYPTIVAVHPGGDVKEQTSGLYASKLSKELGYVTLAFDALFQGESEGKPRQTENPNQRVEDVSASIDYLLTQSFVDPERIAVLGICAGGGYAAAAAIRDPRIKALGVVSAVDIGLMFRHGWDGSQEISAAAGYLQFAASDRTAVATHKQAAGAEIPLAPKSREEAPEDDMKEAYDYYRTPRAQHPNSPSYFPAYNIAALMTFGAFNYADLFLTQPVLAVAGANAGSLWFSKKLIDIAASKTKKLVELPGYGHIDLYDRPDPVRQTLDNLVPFYQSHLT